MRRRAGFTLVEMMVSVALVLFIMVILTEAFGKGLESFRTLKGIGDLEAKLRSAVTVLRRDLAFDHFEGKRRLSDDRLTWQIAGRPREGRFDILSCPPAWGTGVQPEGQDADSIDFQRANDTLLHFTSKARGNDRSEFFTAIVPKQSPLVWGIQGPIRTTFFDQPADARFQEQTLGAMANYPSQWAELAYFLRPSGANAGSEPLHVLYRSQFVLVADNSKLNWPPRPNWARTLADHQDIACRVVDEGTGPRLHFSTPSDLARVSPYNTFDPGNPGNPNAWNRAATPILTDVLSFDVSWLAQVGNELKETSLTRGELAGPFSSAERAYPVNALKITLRVFDPKTKLTRQMTMIQDL